MIQATIKGIGINDEVDLVDKATNATICQHATVISYGLLECLTLAQEFPDLIDISVKDVSDDKIYNCANSDTSKC